MPIDVLFLGGTSIDLIQDKNKGGRPVFLASTGGSITNSAVIGAKLGLKTALISRIGKDPLGDFAVRFLKSCKVNTNGVIQDPGIRTPIAIANIDKHGNSKYTFYKNTSLESIVCLKDAPKGLLNNCKILHFGSSFSYQKDSSIEAMKYVKYLKKRGVFISFDPNVRPYTVKDKKAARNRILRLAKLVDLLKISEVDLKFLTGQRDPKKGLEKLKKLVSCEIVLTLGSKGSAYLHESVSLQGAHSSLSSREATEDEMSEEVPSPPGEANLNLMKIPAFKVKVADTIGAGDAFTAALLYKISKIGERQVFKAIRPALTFASSIAAQICTKPGANQGLKDIKQVNLFL